MRSTVDQIAWYLEMREKAQAQLDLIEQGWRFERGVGSGPMVDVTDDVADRERRTIEMMDRLIEAYGENLA